MITVTVTSGNLFQLAAQYLGDATQWNRIVLLNNLPPDPFLSGTYTLQMPSVDPNAGGGILGYQ